LLNIEPDNKNTKELRRLEDIAEKIETETLERLIAKGSITKQDISNYRGVIEYSQFFREASFIKKLSRFIKLFYLRLKALKSSDKSERNDIRQKYQDGFKHVQKIMRIVNHNIILKMREEQHSGNVLEVSLVINRYTNLTQTLRQSASKIKARQKNELIVSNETQQSLKLQALYTQRDVLDKLIANNKITNDIAKQIRENINYNEIVLASESTH
nr:sodium:proton antiporter [Staphylococcus lugdunensis]